MRENIKTLTTIENNIHKDIQAIPEEINKFQNVIHQIEKGTKGMENSEKKINRKITDTANDFLEKQQNNLDKLTALNKNLAIFQKENKKVDFKTN